MVITILAAFIFVLGCAIIYLVNRLEKGKRGEATLQDEYNRLQRAHERFVRVVTSHNDVLVTMHKIRLEEIAEERDTAVQERADAWMLMGQLLEENVKDRKVPDNVSVEIRRDGVQYVFTYNPGEHDSHLEEPIMEEVR